MLKKRFAWIILIIGLMLNNIGLAIIIGENFKEPLVIESNLYEEYKEEHIDIILIDEEKIPGGRLVTRDKTKLLGYKLYLIGLIITLMDLRIWQVRRTKKIK